MGEKSKIDTPLRSLDETRYLHALDLYKADEHDKCIDAAYRNLADNTLPPYWRMKTLFLITSCSDLWYVVERYRLEMEQICTVNGGFTSDAGAVDDV